MQHARWCALVVGLLGGSACTSTSPRHAVDDVAHDVEARSGRTIRWDQGTADDAQARRALDALLRNELTVDAAVQIALLANPSLQAELEDLAIAQADLVQAGLLKNPVFAVGRTAWEAEHIDPNLFFSVEQDFLDIVTMPLRKRVARNQLETTKLEVTDRVLEVAAEVRTAFYMAQAAEQIVAMRKLVEEAAQASADLARRQREAGTMNDLALQTQLGLAAQATLDCKRAEREAVTAREALNKKMGLWGPRTGWKTAARLPELPPEEPALDRVESTAIDQRFDLAAGRQNLQAMDYAIGLAKTTRWTGTVNVAVVAGRLRGTKHFSFGPTVAIEVPLFDRREAQIARLEALRRQADDALQALAIDVRADVRASRARLALSRSVVEDYAKVMVPVREKVVRFAQQQYDAMLIGVYQLIQAKQGEFDAYREYIEALRDYWIARSDLERAIGGRISSNRGSR